MTTKRSSLRPVGKKIHKAVQEIKNSPAAADLLTRTARGIARRANATLIQKQKYADYNSGFHKAADTKEPTATVYTQSNHAKYSNAKHNTLIRVLHEK